MKKIIYLCLLAVLAVSFGCSKDEVFTEEQSRNSENTELVNGIEKGKFNQKNSTTTDQQDYERYSNTAINIYDEYGVPAGTDVLALYLDMSLIQLNYSGPSYTGSFNDHYKDEMATHFTIYAVESADASCGNIERWIVNKAEYILYTGGTDEEGIIALDVNGGDNSSTSAGNSNATGWGDDAGNVTPKPKKPTNPTNPSSLVAIPIEYLGCF